MHNGEPPSIIFRVDAFVGIGTGHLMRCLALAQAWKDARRGKVMFITYCESKRLMALLQKENFELHLLREPHPHSSDWNLIKKILVSAPDCWVVLDGYHFGLDYQINIKKIGNKLLMIDDMAKLDHYHADLVLNQNLHAFDLKYNCEPNTRLLLGTQYVLLRREFTRRIGFEKKISKIASRILVTLGGTDPNNLSEKVIFSMQDLNPRSSRVKLVVGYANHNLDKLQKAAEKADLCVEIIEGVSDMSKLMEWADVAVSSGGTTVWELAFMGVPSLIGRIAPIEEYLLQGLEKHGVFVNAGSFSEISSEELHNKLDELIHDHVMRRNQSALARNLVDGRGCQRVLSAMGM